MDWGEDVSSDQEVSSGSQEIPATISTQHEVTSSPQESPSTVQNQNVHVSDFQRASGLSARIIELDPGPSTSNPSEGSREHPIEVDKTPQSLETLLQAHSSQVIDSSSEYSLSVDRTSGESLWLSATSFYKRAMVRPEKLRKQLVVSFSETGEIGADSGALRKEFFEDALKEANKRLFDGEDYARIPKKDYTLQVVFELVGMLSAHSILQEGPGFPCMSEAVYDYMTKGECYPCKEDLPLDLATTELHNFIEKVRSYGSARASASTY